MLTLLRQAIDELIAVRLKRVELGFVLGLILHIDLLRGNLISSIIIEGSKLYTIFCIHTVAEHSIISSYLGNSTLSNKVE